MDPGRYLEWTCNCSSEVRTFSTKSCACASTVVETDNSCINGDSSESAKVEEDGGGVLPDMVVLKKG